MIVCDVIVNPLDTAFLQMARRRGAVTLNGLGMFINQGAIAFEKWTGIQASLSAMREAMERAFGN